MMQSGIDVTVTRIGQERSEGFSAAEFRVRCETSSHAILRNLAEVIMKVLDPGHLYQLESLLSEVGGTRRATASALRFVKRIGVRYPGNKEPGYDGTTSQEVLRALIDRAKYVDSQFPDPMNIEVVASFRTALLCLELRAAKERGELDEFVKHLALVRAVIPSLDRLQEFARHIHIEDLPTCDQCGHVGCERHKEKP